MKSIRMNYCIAKVQLHNSPNLVYIPLHDREMVQINIPTHLLAGVFANRYQEKMLDEGKHDSLLQYSLPSEFSLHTTEVEFKASKNHLAFSRLNLEFAYGAQQTPLGWWAVIPVLGIEAFAAKEEELETAVQEAVRLEFIRNRRLDQLQSVLPTIWFEYPEWVNEELDFKAYTPSELENLKKEKKKELLPKVAEKIKLERRVLYGYEAELKQLTEAVKGKFHRNVLLVGKSGIGKTTLVWELARQAINLDINATFWETTAATLIKELTGRTGWQDQLSMLCREIMQTGSVLFIRNLMELFEVGQYEGNNISMGDYLREYLSNGELTLISECTEEELARIELRSPNYTSFFQVIRIEEPKQGIEDIIRLKVEDIAKHQRVVIEPEAIQEAIRLHRRYTPYSGFPGKPIRFLESILLNFKKLSNQSDTTTGTQRWLLDRSTVIRAFCEETGMPPFMVDPAIPMDMEQVYRFFADQLFGQENAVRVVSDMLASVKTALNRQGKPIASMLFVGPTGVGKTELAKILAQFMFGSRDKMIRFDMSEYSSPYSVARLTGESYFSDGVLTSAVRREPFCVLLFDEIEKADNSFNDLLLQLLGEGRLTDSQGKLVNFCSTIVIMTSNIGAQKLQTQSISFNSELDPMDVVNHFQNEVRRYFRPEIFNRIDQIVPFYPLSINVMRHVVGRELELLRRREGIAHRNIEFRLAPEVYDWLCEKGHHARYGARALQRTLHEQLIIPLSEKLNQYSFDDKLVMDVRLRDGQVDLAVETDPLKLELILEELTHNEYMDFASELRAKAYRLKEGKSYVQISSDLAILKNRKRGNERAFWNDREDSENYTHYLALQESYNELRKVIDELEVDMALMTMQVKPLNVKLYEQLKAWEKDYNAYKLRMLHLLYPEYNTTHLGIYGNSFRRFFRMYKWILDKQNFSYTIQSVWFRESLYHEIKTVRIADLIGEGDPVTDEENKAYEADEQAETQREAKAYYRKEYDPDKDKSSKQRNSEDDDEALDGMKADQKDDILLGIELTIKGLGVHLLLEDEGGMHLQVAENKKGNFYAYITSHPDEAYTPEDIHRKNFFQVNRRPRRTYTPDHIEDSVLEFPKREVLPNQQPKFLLDILERNFNAKVDRILL